MLNAFTCQGKSFALPKESFTPPNVRCGKRFIVMTERSVLAQMLWDLKESGDGLSYSKMAARSGGLVAVSTLHGVMSGKTKELTPDTIAGLAKMLGVSDGHILTALRDKPLEPMTLERFVSELQELGAEDVNPAKSMSALTPADMEEIIAVTRSNVRTMVEQKLKAKKMK